MGLGEYVRVVVGHGTGRVTELLLADLRIHPTATRQEVTTGRTPEELLAKLRAERDGTA